MSEKLKAIVTITQLDLAEGLETATVPQMEAIIRLKKAATFATVANGIRAASESSGVPPMEILTSVMRLFSKSTAEDAVEV